MRCSVTKQAECRGSCAQHGVLPATPGAGGRSGSSCARSTELHLEYPFAGQRGCCADLSAANGSMAGRRSCRDADAAHGDRGAVPAPAHNQAEPGHKIYPYLLRGMEIVRPNQVWAMDITYLPMREGLRLPRRGARLGHAPRAGVAGVQSRWHGLVLRRGHWRTPSARAWKTRDLQHRPGFTVHRAWPSPVCSVKTRHRNQHGRQGRLAGQRVRRAAMADASNTRRSTCMPTRACRMRVPRLGGISISTIAAARTRALTA